MRHRGAPPSALVSHSKASSGSTESSKAATVTRPGTRSRTASGLPGERRSRRGCRPTTSTPTAGSGSRSQSSAAERYPVMDATSAPGSWPAESREAAQLVLDKYGPPDEACESTLVWNSRGPWKRIVAYKEFSRHNFPSPHIDAVESFLDLRVPPAKAADLCRFDGSVVVNRTRGEISARCHDEEANFLALNLAHDIIEGKRAVEDARRYYAEEFLNYRKKA